MSDDMDQPLDLGGYAELPQYGIAVSGEGRNISLWLTVNYGTAQHMFYLATPDNYEQVAREVHKQIMDAGVAARRARTGLITAKGNHDATLRQAQGGKQRGPRGKGT